MRASLPVVLDALRQDLVYAVRGLRRSPGLTATIILIFALGIGVNAALFTVVDRVYFQPPPGLVDPGSVRWLVKHESGIGKKEFVTDRFTAADLAQLRDAAAELALIEGYDPTTDKSVGVDGKEKRTVAYTTGGFFKLAGVHAYHGRLFTAEEDNSADVRNVAVLSHAYWQSRFAGSDDILGRTIRVDSTIYRVIGVMQPRFEGLHLDAVEIWVPGISHVSGGEGAWSAARLFARLRSGVDERTVATRLATQFRADHIADLKWDPTLHLELASIIRGRNSIWMGTQRERNRALLPRLAGIALLVIVIATTNVASLLLMRGLRRRREIAVRVALGVAPTRLLQLLVVESVILALVGGAAALVIATWTGGSLRALLFSDVRWSTTVIDARVVLFTGLVTLLVGVVAGLAPGTIALRRDIAQTLKAGSAEAGRARSGLRVGLLVTQTALCMAMLASAGVFIQSLRHAGDVNRGFDADRLVAFEMNWIRSNVVDEAVERFRTLPSVESVARSGSSFRTGSYTRMTFANGDTTSAMLRPMTAYVDAALPPAIGMHLIGGRLFTGADRKESEPVAIINREFARAYWSGKEPIGDCILFISEKRCRRIVGVVENVRWDISLPTQGFVYAPLEQAPYRGASIIIRTRGRATPQTVAEIRKIVEPLGGNPDYLPNPRLVTDQLEPMIRPWRIAAAMFLLFGVLALAAAGAGIYGLVGYDVTQRTREFGVRITLGATAPSILKLVIGSGIRVVAIGLVVGLGTALVSGRVVASLLFETSPYDPIVLAATAVVLTLAALAASLVPAWRATRVDPMVALRAE